MDADKAMRAELGLLMPGATGEVKQEVSQEVRS